MKFRKKIEDYLEPLKQNNVVVHYPFFANTYVLPYFYSTKIQEGVEIVDEKTKDLIKLSSGWGTNANRVIIDNIKKNAKSIHLFYSLDTDSILTNALNESNLTFKKVPFCEYYPQFIFFDFSVDTFLTFYKKKNISKYNSTSDFLTEHFLKIIPETSFDKEFFLSLKKLNVKSINIYSDTLEEAKIIREIIRNSPNREEGLFVSEVNQLTPEDSTQQDTFNIYYYSAPYNIVFLQNKYQYLPYRVKITDDNFKKFSTYAYIVGNKDQEDTIARIGEKTKEFFQYIFWKARETPEHFAEITKSFNKHSAIIHPSIIFDNEYSFAKCLSLHIAPPIRSPQEIDIEYIKTKLTDLSNSIEELTKSNIEEKKLKLIELSNSIRKLIKSDIEDIKVKFNDLSNSIEELTKSNIEEKKLKLIELSNSIEELVDNEKRISKRLIFESLYGYSHNLYYYQEKELLLSKNIKQVYSLIVLNYLMDNTEKISCFRDRSFTSICEALNDATFNEGFYDRVFNCFIQIQVDKFFDSFKKSSIENPIYDAVNNWNIGEEKIKHRLVAEVKYYFYSILIKECRAEDVFLIDSEGFELQKLLNKNNNTISSEKKESITFLNDIFQHVLKISSNYYDDIVASNTFNLSSTFKNTEVKNLIKSKTSMTAASASYK